MGRETAERDGIREAEEPDFKWAVEYLVRVRGKSRAAEMLGVNRKTVDLALSRDRLTSRMNHAVQTLLAGMDDPVGQEVMPLDRMESQIRFLLESMGELDDLVEKLTQRVEALEELQARTEAEAGQADVDAVPEVEEKGEQSERRSGWWRR